MGNDHGRSHALTVLSRIKPFWRAAFLWVVLRGLHFFKASQTTAKDLQFLHFARWTIITRRGLPKRVDRAPSRLLRPKLLLFCTDFNGDFDDYISSFSRVLWLPVNTVWNRCVGFPGAKPVSGLLRYIHENGHDCSFYHSAYPGAGVYDVRQAIELYEQLESLNDADGPEWARYEQFAASAQAALGSPSTPEGG